MKAVLIILLGFSALSAQTQESKKPSMPMSDSMMQKMPMMKAMSNKEGMKMHESMTQDSSSAEAYYYTCPMESHRQVHSDEPGKCPECNMDLVKVVKADSETAEFYGCPMPAHSHVRSDKPGKCPECNMDLQPMRMEKGNASNMD
jgi:rubrerythrin